MPKKSLVCVILRVQLLLCIWSPRVECPPPRCAPYVVVWACMYMRSGPVVSIGRRPRGKHPGQCFAAYVNAADLCANLRAFLRGPKPDVPSKDPA